MEAPLSICTNEEMRGVIRFLFADGIKPVEIIRRMQAQYGDNCLSSSKIYDLEIQLLKCRRFIIANNTHSFQSTFFFFFFRISYA
jgi:hypothetical protein